MPELAPPTTGQLLVGGDWASAHGDSDGLAHVAAQLAERVSEPLKHELIEIAWSCHQDAEQGARQWAQFRHQLSHHPA
jgi:hypothetical protein